MSKRRRGKKAKATEAVAKLLVHRSARATRFWERNPTDAAQERAGRAARADPAPQTSGGARNKGIVNINRYHQ